MTINSISSSNGTQPINIADAKKPAKIANASQYNAAPISQPSAVSTDTLSLTGTASQLRALEQQLASLPVVDIQRVDSVKREISNGSYEINPPKIADKMIQMEMAINQRLV